jgi:hypothetical protein
MDVPLTFRVPRDVLAETWAALAEIGGHGLEGVVLWVAAEPADAEIEILYAITPAQVAFRSDEGLAVMIPDWAVSELITGLPVGAHVPVRVHSHPGAAYHSSTDDTNRLLSHRGAISIVVPDFARHDPDLARCSVNELSADFTWRELDAGETGRRFIVVD